jgi:FemAB-related protein (PEP-CTERM system-associated)
VSAENNISVDIFDDNMREAWTRYVDGRQDATLFHDLRWLEAVKSGYGYRDFNLIARRGGKVCGVLPLTLVASPLLGRSLISTAFAVGGGIVADDEETVRALGARALEIGRDRGVNYVELRGGPAPGDGYREKAGVYAAFEKEMPADPEAIRQWLPRNRRAEVKKAMRIDEANENSFRTSRRVRDFYKVYAPALRNLGTPVMPQKFLTALKVNFGDDVEIGLVEHHGEPIAGLFSFWRRDRVMPYYIGADVKARDIRAYDYLYYTLMKRAVARGIRTFDFGRSKIGSTHYDTKTYWGFEPKPLVYHVALVRAKELPNVNPNNPKFERFVEIWKKLPLPVANLIGPFVARNFP